MLLYMSCEDVFPGRGLPERREVCGNYSGTLVVLYPFLQRREPCMGLRQTDKSYHAGGRGIRVLGDEGG